MKSYFLANSIWRIAHKFGKGSANMANFSLVFPAGTKRQMLVKLNGGFFAKRRLLASCCSAFKVWWNRPQGYLFISKQMSDSEISSIPRTFQGTQGCRGIPVENPWSSQTKTKWLKGRKKYIRQKRTFKQKCSICLTSAVPLKIRTYIAN